MINDKDVIEYFNYARYIKYSKRKQEYIQYLLNRFNDFTTYNDEDKCKESLYRIKHNIEICPICELCGKKLKYLVNMKCYESACCNEHKHILANQRLSKTSKEKYGTLRPSQSQKVKDKQKQTNLSKYGSISPLQNKHIKEKTKYTLLSLYNVDNIAKSQYWKDSVNRTSLQKYGELYPNQNKIIKNKIKQSLLLKYGVDNYLKIKEVQIKARSKESINKSIQTKRINGTFNTSKIEIDTYNILKEKYPDVIYQYKDKERYPFVCDFYIPSLDLFIECNYHWTHGGKPYEGTDSDKEKANCWKSKNSKYYNNAINCWTIRDVKKRETAKQNGLNYIEVWDIDEINII